MNQPEPELEAAVIKTAPEGAGSLIFSPDGETLAYRHHTPAVPEGLYCWTVNDDSKPRLLAQNIAHATQGISFTPDSRYLIVADSSQVISVINVKTGQKIRSFATIDTSKPQEWSLLREWLALSPDGQQLAFVSPSTLGVDLWNLDKGEPLFSLPEDESGAVYRLAWSPDSHRLAVTRSNGQIAIWNLQEIHRVLAMLSLSP